MTELDELAFQAKDWIAAAKDLGTMRLPDIERVSTGLGVVTVRFLMSQAHELHHIEQRLRAIEAALADAQASGASKMVHSSSPSGLIDTIADIYQGSDKNAALRDIGKIAAIRRLRNISGIGLKEAKEQIEMWAEAFGWSQRSAEPVSEYGRAVERFIEESEET